MNTTTSNVIVDRQACTFGPVHAVEVHHRDFPELRSEGQTAAEAVSWLRQRMLQELESSPSHWRKSAMEKAIGELEEFLAGED